MDRGRRPLLGHRPALDPRPVGFAARPPDARGAHGARGGGRDRQGVLRRRRPRSGPQDRRARVPSDLLSLVRKELIRPERTTLPGEDAFRFRHLLVRDSAYDSIPKAQRAELHERFADWLERVAGDSVAEQEEIVAYHLEQAHVYRLQLGPADDRSSAIGAVRPRACPRQDGAPPRAVIKTREPRSCCIGPWSGSRRGRGPRCCTTSGTHSSGSATCTRRSRRSTKRSSSRLSPATGRASGSPGSAACGPDARGSSQHVHR